MKAIFTDYNFFGKKIVDVESLEVTGEPSSDRHVITRKRGELLKSEAIQQAREDITEATRDLVNQTQLETEVRQEIDVSLPSAVSSEIEKRMEVSEITISDNIVVSVPVGLIGEMYSVIYSIQSSISNEKGTITIHETDAGYSVETVRYASRDKYAPQIDFEAREDNGSLVLDIIGSGSGLLTVIKYRTNTFNTLEI